MHYYNWLAVVIWYEIVSLNCWWLNTHCLEIWVYDLLARWVISTSHGLTSFPLSRLYYKSSAVFINTKKNCPSEFKDVDVDRKSSKLIIVFFTRPGSNLAPNATGPLQKLNVAEFIVIKSFPDAYVKRYLAGKNVK